VAKCHGYGQKQACKFVFPSLWFEQSIYSYTCGDHFPYFFYEQSQFFEWGQKDKRFAHRDYLKNNSQQTTYAFLLQLPVRNTFFYICSLHQFSSHPRYHLCCSHMLFQPLSVVFFFLVSILKLKHKHNLTEGLHLKKLSFDWLKCTQLLGSTVYDLHLNIQFWWKVSLLKQNTYRKDFLSAF